MDSDVAHKKSDESLKKTRGNGLKAAIYKGLRRLEAFKTLRGAEDGWKSLNLVKTPIKSGVFNKRHKSDHFLFLTRQAGVKDIGIEAFPCSGGHTVLQACVERSDGVSGRDNASRALFECLHVTSAGTSA